MQREADFGGFLTETFALIGDGARGVALFVLVIGGIGALGIGFGQVPAESEFGLSAGFSVDSQDTPFAGLFQLGSAVISIVASYFLLTNFLQIRGRLPDRSVRIWAYLGLSILWGLGIIIGLFFLVIPGVILATRWSASAGFLIGGGRSISDALSDSWHATRGKGFAIFFAGVVTFIVLAAIGSMFGLVGYGSGASVWLASLSAFLEAFASALFLAFGIAVYLLVDQGAEDVGDVFS